MSKNLVDNFRYFTEHHDELFEQYPNKFVLIKDKSVILSGDTFEEVYTKAVDRGLKIGTFIIQECTSGDAAFTQFFSNQIVFA